MALSATQDAAASDVSRAQAVERCQRWEEFVRELGSGSSRADVALHEHFAGFQQEMLRLREEPDAERALASYSERLAAELRQRRDSLRRAAGAWSAQGPLGEEYESLCFCLALWELVHEVLVCRSGPTAPALLHWFNRHYREDELALCYEEALRLAASPLALDEATAEGARFWDRLWQLAVGDCCREVLALLRRARDTLLSAGTGSALLEDRHLARFCEFLEKCPSLYQMHLARAGDAEVRRVVLEIQQAAREQLPVDRPKLGRLLEIYAGCRQGDFGKATSLWTRRASTWLEDFVHTHAWLCPDLRRVDLAELLRAVCEHRSSEEVDDLDRIFFAVFSMDVPALLDMLRGLPELFPASIRVHLVDVLYFARRVPPRLELAGLELPSPRDLALMEHGLCLMSGARDAQRQALDYLRAGGAPACRRLLELAVERYGLAELTDLAELEPCLELCLELGLGNLGAQLCRRRGRALMEAGEVRQALRLLRHAEAFYGREYSGFVSEVLDEALEDPRRCEALLSSLGEPEEPEEPELPEAGRLRGLSEYARCLRLRQGGRPVGDYAPGLARALCALPPRLARNVLEHELLEALEAPDQEPALDQQQVLDLMAFVQQLAADPLQRVGLTKLPALHNAMGRCLSMGFFREPRIDTPSLRVAA